MTLSLTDYAVDFDAPQYLLLLLLLPLLWWTGRGSLAALENHRRWGALALRAAVLTIAVFALAEVQFVRTADRLAVIYLLDRSLSVSPHETARAIEFINASRASHRDRNRGDLAGVIVFGREAAVELPPLAEDVPLLQIESPVDSDVTNLASGMRLASACFPSDCAKRLVILSDGNENIESALDEARSFLEGEIGIDVVPLRHPKQTDVLVEKIAMPTEVRRKTPFEVRAVLQNTAADDAESVRGQLRVTRRTGMEVELVAVETIEVRPGRQVFNFRQEIDSADFYTYDVQFIADDAAHDALLQNNRASAFTQVRGQGRVLLIEDVDRPGEFQHLVERLRAAQLDVEVALSDNAFVNLADLQRYDSVILANVARTSGDDALDLTQFSDEQVEMLVRNTEQLGSGLIMLGGPNSFGAGGWNNTLIEDAMPVDFHIKNPKVVPQGALMLVIDTSGSMSGDKIAMSKAAAVAAVKVLGEHDYVGVIAFDSEARTIVPLQRVGTGASIIFRISELGANGGTNMYPGMRQGYQALVGAKAAIKHMIVLTDGQTEGSGFEPMAADFRRLKITTTSVAIGSESDGRLMRNVASAGGGKFYNVHNARAIPRIFMKEALRVARPLVYENPRGIMPRAGYPHEMIAGMADVPPVTGYVLTTAKRNPLVEIAWTAAEPSPGNHPLLASWTYGLGRSVALTTDAGQRWARSWTGWENYDKLFTQMVRWSMRPTMADSRFAMSADAHDGKLQIVVSALDQDQGYLNFLAPRGTVVDPSNHSTDLTIVQTAPGRYVAEFPADAAGNYFVSIVPDPDSAPLRTGVNVSYSPEFRQDYDENASLLTALASQAPQGGTTGRVIEASLPLQNNAEDSVFRRDLPKPKSRQACWHFLLLATGCVFFLDVFNRRVAWTLSVVMPTAQFINRLRNKDAVPAPSEVLARLSRRKQEITEQIEQRQPNARWTGEHSVEVGDNLSLESLPTVRDVRPSIEAPSIAHSAGSADDESYTSRLLSAKRKIWEERRTGSGKPPEDKIG